MYKLPGIIDEKDNSVVLDVVSCVYTHKGQVFLFVVGYAEYGNVWVWGLLI